MASSYTKSVEDADFKFQIKYIGSVPCFENNFENKSEIIKLGPIDYIEEISFEEAAEKYSTCPSKEKGGQLGRFRKGQMVKEFEEAAKNAEIGKITEPVKTQFGYHIIRLDDRTEEGTLSFDEVKDQIRNQVLGLKQQEAYLNNIEKISKEYDVEKFY